MQPNLSERSELAEEPLVQVMDDLVPAHLHAAAWAVCQGRNWYFGHGSNQADWSRFWRMDLDGDEAFNAIWDHVRPRMEALVGGPLRVLRQYANGHTYGLGGNPHKDDPRPGTYTLLYYPNEEWKDAWDGETVFYDQQGEIALSVRLRPNRAVFFDSRVLHNGRAPSRLCPALRVTVAYKIEVDRNATSAWNAATLPKQEQPGPEMENGSSDPTRLYRVRIPSATINAAVEEQLAVLAGSVRIPGFRAGKIPLEVLQQRYGAQARSEVLHKLRSEAVQRVVPKDGVVSSAALRVQEGSGDVELEITATSLSSLPPPVVGELALERLVASEPTPEANEFLRSHLRTQVLDHLDVKYSFPLPPQQVERELAAIWKNAEESGELPGDAQQRKQMREELWRVAERRVRLGLVVTEIGRRLQLDVQGAALEDEVIHHLIGQARVTDREVSAAEFAQRMKD